jgi:hypothetical protein
LEADNYLGHTQDFVSSLQFWQEIYSSENRRWSAAFKPLLLSIPSTNDNFLNARILNIRSHAIAINLAGSLSPSELVYDSFFREFKEIVTLAKAFLSHPRSSKILTEGSFSLTSRLIHPLQLVADKCRDRQLRREAIGMLKSKPWREGSWSSLATATVATWFMEVEEEGVETDFIPEQARLKLIESEFSEEQVPRQYLRATVRCLRGVEPQAELKESTWVWTFEAPNVYGSKMGQAIRNI